MVFSINFQMALVFSDVLQLDSLFAGKIPVGSISFSPGFSRVLADAG
jgi:hypothetical protein